MDFIYVTFKIHIGKIISWEWQEYEKWYDTSLLSVKN